MVFIIDIPHGITAPKGLNLPKLEDIKAAIRLTESVLRVVDTDFEDVEEFNISLTDEVYVLEGKLIDYRITGEGIIIYPTANPWDMGEVFEAILHGLYE